MLTLAFYFSNNFVLVAPNVIHYDVDETVLITIEGKQANPTVQLYLQDYPERKRMFSKLKNQRVRPGKGCRFCKGSFINEVDLP